MGCGAAKATKTDESANKDGNKVPKPVSFEIPAVDTESQKKEESLVKKYPPKRLQRLEEQGSNVISFKDLEKKQQEAEERRQSLLEERINKSRSFQQKLLEKGDKGGDNDSEKDEASPAQETTQKPN